MSTLAPLPLPPKPAIERLGVTVAEAMESLGFRSRSSFYKWADEVGLKPFHRGLYRMSDIRRHVTLGRR
jgi:hypothetical protein